MGRAPCVVTVHVCRSPSPQEDAQELADPVRLARLIKQYSQFIQFPIKLWSARKEAKQVRHTNPHTLGTIYTLTHTPVVTVALTPVTVTRLCHPSPSAAQLSSTRSQHQTLDTIMCRPGRGRPLLAMCS